MPKKIYRVPEKSFLLLNFFAGEHFEIAMLPLFPPNL